MKSNTTSRIRRTIFLTPLLAVLIIPLHQSIAKGKPPGNGGPPFFGRVDFLDGPAFNVVSDGAAGCTTGDHPWGGLWDYWDTDDPGCPAEGGIYQSDMDTGGRWIFTMWSESERYLVFHWNPLGDSPANPNLDAFLAPDIADPTPGVDNLRVRLNADNLFKVGTDRQLTDLNIWEYGSGRPYSLEYTDPLYIVRYPGDPDLVILTTEGDPALNQPNLREAQLTNSNARGRNNPDRIVGFYEMPLTIVVRRIPAP